MSLKTCIFPFCEHFDLKLQHVFRWTSLEQKMFKVFSDNDIQFMVCWTWVRNRIAYFLIGMYAKESCKTYYKICFCTEEKRWTLNFTLFMTFIYTMLTSFTYLASLVWFIIIHLYYFRWFKSAVRKSICFEYSLQVLSYCEYLSKCHLPFKPNLSALSSPNG